jgi:hypothetical protein
MFQHGRDVRSVPLPDTQALFDHFVCGREQRRWDRHAARFGGLKIDDEFKFDGLLDRQVRGLFTPFSPSSRAAASVSLHQIFGKIV